jgi:hypothetical protein
VNNEGPVYVLAISGSLRRGILKARSSALRFTGSSHGGMSIYRGLAELPAFNRI